MLARESWLFAEPRVRDKGPCPGPLNAGLSRRISLSCVAFACLSWSTTCLLLARIRTVKDEMKGTRQSGEGEMGKVHKREAQERGIEKYLS